jgi:transposase
MPLKQNNRIRAYRTRQAVQMTGTTSHTSKLEGVNNKIKVIKRKAYGYHDQRYFTLKVYQVFSGAN